MVESIPVSYRKIGPWNCRGRILQACLVRAMQHAKQFRHIKVGHIKQMKTAHRTWDLWARMREDDNRNGWNIELAVQFVEGKRRSTNWAAGTYLSCYVRSRTRGITRRHLKQQIGKCGVQTPSVTGHLRVNQISARFLLSPPKKHKSNNPFSFFPFRQVLLLCSKLKFANCGSHCRQSAWKDSGTAEGLSWNCHCGSGLWFLRGKKIKLRGLRPRTNYTDRATATYRRS
jgi:hypothetical protein